MAEYVMVPDGDESNDGTWGALGGGSLFAAVDEGTSNDGDTTYIQGSHNVSGVCRLRLAPMVDAQFINSITVEAIRSNAGAGTTQEFRLGIRVGPTGSDTMGSFVVVNGAYAVQTIVHATNPVTSAPWTKANLDDLIVVLETRDTTPPTDSVRVTALYIRVNYEPIPIGISSAREIASHRERRYRRPLEVANLKATLAFLDNDLMDDFSIVHFAGPQAQGQGWGDTTWKRRLHQVRELEIDPNDLCVGVKSRGRNEFLTTYWNTLESRRSSSATEDGTSRVGQGQVETCTRNSKAWHEDPGSGLVVEHGVNQKPIAKNGTAIEQFKKNYLKRSSFVSGGTGFGAATGTGTVTFPTSPPSPLFDPTVSNTAMKHTAGNPHTVDLVQAWPVSDTLGANSNYCLSIDHLDDPGANYRWRLQRAIDSRYWNDAASTWDVAVVNNVWTASTVRVRDRSKAIPIGTSSTTVTLSVLQLAGTPNARVNWTYHVQLEDLEYPTSRIVTDSATYAREVETYFVPQPSGARVWNNTGGTG